MLEILQPHHSGRVRGADDVTGTPEEQLAYVIEWLSEIDAVGRRAEDFVILNKSALLEVAQDRELHTVAGAPNFAQWADGVLDIEEKYVCELLKDAERIRPVVADSLCRTCRVASQTDRDRIETEWHAARAAAIAVVVVEEGHARPDGQVQLNPMREQPLEDVTSKAATLAAELDEDAAYQEAAARAEQHRQEQERAARRQAEETARIRAQLADQHPDLAAVSASTQEAQEAQQPVSAPF